MPDPTVVVARLDNKELQESINQMVKDFEKGLTDMKSAANSAVEDLQKTLKKLSDTKVDSSGSADGGSSRRKKTNDEETQSIKNKTAATKEFTATLDQQAQAVHKAMQPKSARDSYYTFTKHYSDQAKALEPLIQSFEQNLSALIQKRINEINRTITASKLKIQELNQELNRGYASGNQTAIQQTQAAIEKENRFIKEQQELLKNVGQEFVVQKMYLTGLVAEHQHLSNYMKDELVNQARSTAQTEQQKAKIKELTERLKLLNEEKKKVLEEKRGLGWDRFGLKVQSGAYPNDVSIKERLVETETAYAAATQRVKDINDEIKKVTIELQNIKTGTLETERKLAETTEARRAAVERMSKLSKEDLQATFKQFSSAPATGFDQMLNKLEQMKMVVAAMRSSGLFDATELNKSQTAVDNIEKKLRKMPEYAERAAQSEKKSTEEFERTLSAVTKTAAQKKEEAEITEKAAQAEKRWADNTKDRGRAAQENAQKMIRLLHEEAQAGGSGVMGFYMIDGKEINAVRELNNALKEMRMAYNLMSDSEKASPVGEALKRDIAITEEASRKISAYNALALGMTRGDRNLQGRDLLRQEAASYNSLKNTLKILTDQYHGLTAAQIKAGKADGLIQKIQTLTRESQKLQNQLNRPVSFDAAMKLSARTLDDMAYKLRMLQAYKNNIDLMNPNTASEISKVDAAIVQLKKDMDKYMSSTKVAEQTTNALTRSLNYMKNRLAFYFTVGASTQFVKNLIDIRAQYEMNERALGILINSAERGSQIFKELSDMALVSPYTLIELSTAAKQLTAYDIAAKDVVDTTRRLADMTAAVGIPIERLTYAIGQVKAYGYLNARDARMFSNAGIPLVKELADYYTKLEGRIVSVADVYDKIKKKAIDYNSVMNVVTKMTDEGGKFFDFQAKMAGNLKVQLANLTLAWNNMLNEIGTDSQGLLASTIGGLKNLFLAWKEIDKIIQTVLVSIGLWKAIQLSALLVTGKLNGALATQVLVGTKLQAKWASLAASVKSSISAYHIAGAAFIYMIADAIMTYRRNAEEVEELNKKIADGAKESSEALSKMLASSEMRANRISASTGKLSRSDAEKTWEALREQIELSSASAKTLIPELLKIEDVNERLTAAFNLAERIKDANSKLSDLYDKLEVSQDTMLFGAFGEGLAEDIEDYNERLKYTAEVTEWAAKKNKGFWENAAMGLSALFNEAKDALGSDTKEAEDEIRKFAESAASVIKDELGEEGIKDKVQVNEAIARIVQGMEQQFPQIKGKGKMLFETMFNDVMANEFVGAVDKQAYYYNIFLNRLKKDHGSAFQQVTNNILEDTHEWNSAQIDAINKTADKIKKDLPEASQDAINKILQQLNSTDFKIRIVTEFAETTEDEINKQFRKRFIDKSFLEDNAERERQETAALQKYGTLMKKNNESDLEYQKRIKDEKQKQLDISKVEGAIIKENTGKSDEGAKAVLANAEAAKKTADDTLAAIEQVEKWGGYDFTTKKENAAANKAQKEAESDLQRALKEEIQLIDKARSSYKTLTKEGVDSQTAIEQATSGFEKTLRDINSVLIKNGLKVFDITKYTGVENPREILNLLETQLNQLMTAGNAKPAEIEALEVKIRDLKIDAATFDQKKFVSSLNNELSKIKEEYELAVDLDANPELGNVFADLIGISEEQLQDLPRNFDSVLKKMQAKIDTILGSEKKFDLAANLNKKVFEQWIDANGMLLDSDKAKALKAYVDAANKIRQDETKKQIDEWNKLLEKYAEYEYKRKTIMETAERERKIAIQKGASQEIINAINNRERQDLAKLDFEEFQKTPEWIVATGDLANLSKSAIGLLIRQIEEYKRTARDLSPKQIKQLNNALSKLYKEQRRNNPFKAISNMLQEARDRMATFDEDIKKVQKEIDDLTKKKKESIVEGIADEETDNALNKAIKRFKELKKAQKEAGKVDASGWVAAINETTAAVKSAVMVFDDLINAISGVSESDIGKAFGVVEKAGSTAAIGAQIGGVYGAVAGGLIGAVSGFISTFGDELSGNASITKSVKESENAVKRLEIAYIDLQRAIDKAYGSEVVGAKQAMAAAKEKELEELEKQLELERSRESKNRDEDKILELKKRIKELRYEIKDTIEDITNDLMGTDAYSFAERLVSSMIDAFKKGEDYMKVFEESFDSMVDNMIMKAIVSRVVGIYLDKIWKSVEDNIQARSKKESDEYGRLKSRLEELESMDYYEYAQSYGTYNTPKSDSSIAAWERKRQEEIERTKKELDAAKANYDAVSQLNNEDISSLIQQLAELKPELAEQLKQLLGQWYTFGSDSDSSLSALQQGIQGITEDTAGALEAYMNGVSQQVYLQSEYLRQIVEFLSTSNGELEDVKVATLSQMLLQLQNCYQIMQSMHNMMDNWQVASGNGIRVELIS